MGKGIKILFVLVITVSAVLFFNRGGIENSLKVAPVLSESSYTCSGGMWIDAQFSDRQVTIALSDGRSFTLEQKVSASGSKYGNEGNAVVFWTKGSEAYVEENDSQTYTNCASPTAKSPSVVDYFAEEMWKQGSVNMGGAMPIEGFDADLLKGAFPQLTDNDFDGVVTYEGNYHIAGGELTFTRGGGETISTAERTISKEGMGMLLLNLSKRLKQEFKTEESVRNLITALSLSIKISE